MATALRNISENVFSLARMISRCWMMMVVMMIVEVMVVMNMMN